MPSFIVETTYKNEAKFVTPELASGFDTVSPGGCLHLLWKQLTKNEVKFVTPELASGFD